MCNFQPKISQKTAKELKILNKPTVSKPKSTEITRVFLDQSDVSDQIKIELKNPGDSAKINVVYLGFSKINLKYEVKCLTRDTKADIFVCGILMSGSTKNLEMNIYFEPGSIRAEGHEKEDVFLLSDQVTNISRPNIFCAEEDVVGVHGASIGHIDENYIYYMTSRGLSRKSALNLLIKAKLYQILPRISDPKARLQIKLKIDSVFKSSQSLYDKIPLNESNLHQNQIRFSAHQ